MSKNNKTIIVIVLILIIIFLLLFFFFIQNKNVQNFSEAPLNIDQNKIIENVTKEEMQNLLDQVEKQSKKLKNTPKIDEEEI
jgi:predicted negative regulator of RcsB-dependent stress response